MTDCLYKPDIKTLKHSNIVRFAGFTGKKPEEVYQYSIENVAVFWDRMQAFLGVRWIKPFERVLDESRGMAWSRWFVNGRINIEDNCIERNIDLGLGNKTAMIFDGEDGVRIETTYAGLRQMVHRATALLRSNGLGKGDRVAVYGPINAQVTAAMFAIARAGMVFVPLFSGFGEDALYSRLSNAGVKAIFTVDGFWHKGEAVPTLFKLLKIAKKLPDLKHVIVIPRLGWPIPTQKEVILWPEHDVEGDDSLCETDSEDPFMVIHTSGTTGNPKGAVHVHGGFLVKIAEEVSMQTDVKQDDRLMWVSDIGWIMGPWELVGGLFAGATVVSMEGSISFPQKNRLWKVVSETGVTVLGIAPTAIRMSKILGTGQFQGLDLSRLKALASTGEPWDDESWLWFFNAVGHSRLPIINISGGTEVGACFLSPHPITPLKPKSLGGPSLGMAVDVFDANGQPVIGQVGELVCKRPWPGMTRGLFKAGALFEETYFSTFPGVWRHGDLAMKDKDGQWYIFGRSDDIIKVAGRRVGPSEVENLVADIDGVVEAAAIGVPDQIKGEAVVVFAVITGTAEPGKLKKKIIQAVQTGIGKPFTPREVHFISDLPKTRNAKVLRRLIRHAYTGREFKIPTSLVNPDIIKEIQGLFTEN